MEFFFLCFSKGFTKIIFVVYSKFFLITDRGFVESKPSSFVEEVNFCEFDAI